VPASELVTRSRAALGIMPAGNKAGAGVCSLDWDRKWRVTPACTESQDAWPEAESGGNARLMRTAVERREASALRL
jgi:hypothetical protein